MDKNSKIQDIFKKAEELKLQKQQEGTSSAKIPLVEDVSLPSTFIDTKGIMLSSKDVMTRTSYLDKLDIDHDQYKHLKFTPDQAKRIQNTMSRLTTGVTAVVPLICTGSACAFAKTCIEVGTFVSTVDTPSGYTVIESLTVGQRIYSFNIETSKVEHDIVEAVTYMGYKPVYEIKTHTGLVLNCTEDHPILTESKKGLPIWRSIEEGLKVGSKVYISDTDGIIDDTLDSLGDLLIDSIETIEFKYKNEVYDITIRKNENFFANNILVHNCPYQIENLAPIGGACLVEVNLIHYWMEKYMAEFELDETSLTDLHTVSRLCEYDIYDMRVTKYLAENDQNLLTDFISSVDENNNIISNKAISAAFEAKERINNMRSKTLKELLATREAKAKVAAVIDTQSATSSLSEMRAKLDQLIKDKGRIIDSTATKVTPL